VLVTHILYNFNPIEFNFLSLVPAIPLVSSVSCRVFGCFVFVHSHNPNCSKLGPRTLKYACIGYPLNKKGYKCYHLESHCVYITMDVFFHGPKSFCVSFTLQG